jgi:hypothetical protein
MSFRCEAKVRFGLANCKSKTGELSPYRTTYRQRRKIRWAPSRFLYIVDPMSEGQPDRVSRLVAEELLATIFGDDLAGCRVSLDDVARIIQTAIEQRVQQEAKLLDLYNTVVASIHQLTTPPESARTAGPNELRSLLGERMDAIRAITTKTLETTARIRAERTGESET